MKAKFSQQDLDEMVRARRALMMEPLMSGEHPDFKLVRRHEKQLRKDFAEILGYDLKVRSDRARLFKRCVGPDFTRPLRVPAEGHPDRWRPFTRRHYILFCLCLAALEDSGMQVTISSLAEAVRSRSREAGLGIDFVNREDRIALRDALGQLEHLGVLSCIDGAASTWVSERQGSIALYDVDRGLLGDVLCAKDAVSATDVQSMVSSSESYPPTREGQASRNRHMVARRLAEWPILYFDDLQGEQFSYYHDSQRPVLDRRVAALLGLTAERRNEGTALVDPAFSADSSLSDLRLPYNQMLDRQMAVMLCPVLFELSEAGQEHVSLDDARQHCRELAESHFNFSSSKAEAEIDDLLGKALGVMEGLRLIERTPQSIRALPLLARFRSVEINEPKERNS